MKKTVKLIALVLAMALLALSLVACKNEVEENTPPTQTSNVVEVGNQSSGQVMRLVIGGENEKIYSVDYSGIELKDGAKSVIEYLAANHGLAFEESNGMITKIGDLKSEGSTYIFLWTSVESDFDLSEWASTKDWGGINLCTAGVGIADMSLENGAVIYVGTIDYGS